MAAGPAARLGPDQAARAIKARALELGFEAVGIASATPLDARAHYEAWLAAGRHGGMGYLASPKHRARRDDPARLLRDLRSVVCVALCHEPARDAARDRRLGRIARYAAGEDYHRVMHDRLLALERWIERQLLPGSRALWYSDTGAILGQFISAAPTRIIDTRDPSNDAGHAGPLGGNQTLSLPVSGGGKCPAGSSGAVLNVTVTDTSASSFLRVYPSDAAAQTSDLNWTAGTTIPNLVMVRLSQADGSVTIYNLTGAANVVADLNGCFN